MGMGIRQQECEWLIDFQHSNMALSPFLKWMGRTFPMYYGYIGGSFLGLLSVQKGGVKCPELCFLTVAERLEYCCVDLRVVGSSPVCALTLFFLPQICMLMLQKKRGMPF